MKLNIDLDCTPEKAREFFGLPEIEPIQQAAKTRVQRQMLDAVVAIAPAAALKTWFQRMPPNPAVSAAIAVMAGQFGIDSGSEHMPALNRASSPAR